MATNQINNLAVESVFTEGLGTAYVEVSLNGVDVDDILEQIPMEEAISAYGAGELLDLIGRDEAIKHFGIKEKI